jgi:transposase
MDEETYKEVEALLPTQRGNGKISDRRILEAVVYICRNGCAWRGLSKEYGNWHTIYMRLNRWAKNGVLERIYEILLRRRRIGRELRVVALDSTTIKVQQDGTGGGEKKA